MNKLTILAALFGLAVSTQVKGITNSKTLVDIPKVVEVSYSLEFEYEYHSGFISYPMEDMQIRGAGLIYSTYFEAIFNIVVADIYSWEITSTFYPFYY